MRCYQRQWFHVAPKKGERLSRARAWKSTHPEDVRRDRERYEALHRERRKNDRMVQWILCDLRRRHIDFGLFLGIILRHNDKIEATREAARMRNRTSLRAQVAQLSDFYVKRSILRNHPAIGLPLGLIEAKRAQLKLKRRIKELSK
jgi:hypothetical protein